MGTPAQTIRRIRRGMLALFVGATLMGLVFVAWLMLAFAFGDFG
jgi:hypothetical protein